MRNLTKRNLTSAQGSPGIWEERAGRILRLSDWNKWGKFIDVTRRN